LSCLVLSCYCSKFNAKGMSRLKIMGKENYFITCYIYVYEDNEVMNLKSLL